MASSTLSWTDATGQVHMNSAAYQSLLKTKSDDSLKYIIKDATEAMEAMPQGNNAGYYADEVNYAAMELKSRYRKDAHGNHNC